MDDMPIEAIEKLMLDMLVLQGRGCGVSYALAHVEAIGSQWESFGSRQQRAFEVVRSCRESPGAIGSRRKSSSKVPQPTHLAQRTAHTHLRGRVFVCVCVRVCVRQRAAKGPSHTAHITHATLHNAYTHYTPLTGLL